MGWERSKSTGGVDDKVKGGSGGGQYDREKVRGCDRKREGGRKRDENKEKTGREE